MNYSSPFNLYQPKNLFTDDTPFDSILELISKEKHQLLTTISGVKDPILISRGESQLFTNPLLPKIFRELDSFKNEQSEIQKYETEHPDLSEDKLRLFSRMQHYDKPTRLTDWSKCTKIALFFACNKEKDYDKDGVLYLFIPNLSINHQSPMKSFSLNEVSLYINSIKCGIDEKKHIDFWDEILKNFKEGMIFPWSFPIDEEHLDHDTNLRRRAQQGIHIFHPGYLTNQSNSSITYRLIPEYISKKYSIKELRENLLISLIIPASQKLKILKELDELYGINAKQLLLENY